jgi:putative transposase
MTNVITEYPQFFTGTILEWKKLLQPDKYKNTIIESFSFLVKDKRIIIYAFVIMDNHIHLIWQMQAGIKPEAVQRDFLRHTAQEIKADLQLNHPKVLARFEVKAKDRQYQFWERNSLSVELRTDKVFQQKLNYIHHNPVKAGLCNLPEEYRYSSASLYEINKTEWEFLTHYKD